MIKIKRKKQTFKKAWWLIFSIVCFSLSPLATQGAQAASLVKLTPWYEGLVDSDNKIMTVTEFRGSKGYSDSDEDKNKALTLYVTQVVLNVIASALTVIGYITLVFVLYGGFQFITGAGAPEKMVNARKTIMNASIGTVIVLSSSAIIQLLSDNKLFSPDQYTNVGQIYTALLGVFSYAMGAAAVIVIILSGFTMVTSGDKPDSVKKARNGIMFASIGLVVIFFANVFVKWLIGRI